MKAEAFLSRCDKVRATGTGTWIACCPAHEDKHPSMTVRELDDGRVLVHCFGGCRVEEILSAVGMSFDALFPDKPIEHGKPVRRPFPAADVLEALALEMQVATLIAGDMYEKRTVSEEGLARLLIAKKRIEQARDIANGPQTPFRLGRDLGKR